jgi:hypothetical protein
MFNIEQLKRAHAKALVEQHHVIEGATIQIMREAQRLAQGQNAIRDRTGRLRSGWLWKVQKILGGAKGTLYNAVPYAAAQERGSGLHGKRGAKYRIEARRSGMLRFRGRNGELVFRRYVMHPGVKARWIGRAAMFGHAAPFSGVDMLNSKRIFERWMQQAARRF